MSVENLFFFTHQVDQFFLFIHETKTIFHRFFYKRFSSKFKQIFIKRRLVELKLYKRRREVYINQSEQQVHLYIPNIVCCLETNFLNLMSFSVTIKRFFLCFSPNSYFVLLGSVHIPLNKHNLIITTIVISNIKNCYFP